MTDPIQEQLIAARKNQILDAAALVFAEKGFHSTTIRDIARQAGISDGTIYNYFDNKTALLLGIFTRMRAAIMAADRPPPAPDVDFRGVIKASLTHPLMALRDDNFALFRVVASEMMINEELRVLYNEQILRPTLASAEAVLQAHGLPTEKIGLTVRAISALVLGLIMEYVMGDPVLVQEWDELPEFLTELLLNGMAKD